MSIYQYDQKFEHILALEHPFAVGEYEECVFSHVDFGSVNLTDFNFSGIGNASMSPRINTVSPGLSPVSIAAIPLVVSCKVMSRGRPCRAASTASRVRGRWLPSSGHL